MNYRRVVRQRQAGGDILFDYADVIEEFDQPYDDHERPARQTIVTERDGRQVRYLFNRFGNALYREEYAILGGLPKLIGAHYRYNRDGNQIAAVTPMGVTTQSFSGATGTSAFIRAAKTTGPRPMPGLPPRRGCSSPTSSRS